MSDKKFYAFKEVNDWEGESWYFYVPLTIKEKEHLEDLLERIGPDSPYTLEGDISEEEIDVLVKNTNEGYMPEDNKCSGAKVDILSLTYEDFEEDDFFYKGQIWKK